jgi:hypothetical protein
MENSLRAKKFASGKQASGASLLSFQFYTTGASIEPNPEFGHPRFQSMPL